MLFRSLKQARENIYLDPEKAVSLAREAEELARQAKAEASQAEIFAGMGGLGILSVIAVIAGSFLGLAHIWGNRRAAPKAPKKLKKEEEIL